MHLIFFGFFLSRREVLSGAVTCGKHYTVAFIIGLLFMSLPCSRNHKKRKCECGCECGALGSLEWEMLVSECILSDKIDFASHSYRKNYSAF